MDGVMLLSDDSLCTYSVCSLRHMPIVGDQSGNSDRRERQEEEARFLLFR